MATITAQATGNWSATGTWAGGVLPGAADVAECAGYTVTIDQDVTVTTLQSSSTGHFAVTAAPRSITGNIVSASGHSGGAVVRCSHTTGTVTVTGNITAGPNVGLLSSSSGGLAIVGHVQAGTATNAHGVNIANASSVATVTGNVTGGSGSLARGVMSTGTLTVNGNATGGTGTGANGVHAGAATANVLVTGICYGSPSGSASHGLYGSNADNLAVFRRAVFGGATGAPLGGYVQIDPAYAGENYVEVPRSDTSAPYRLSNDYPANAQVEDGVTYHLGTQTGTLAAGGGDPDEIATAVLAAMNLTPPKVKLDGTQPAVTFGQVKIVANVANEGALHVVNSNANGLGQVNRGGKTGQMNEGFTIGQHNEGGVTGQHNEGGTGNVSGVDATGIRSAVGLATANLDAQLAAKPNSQGVRDALKLAPSAGAAAAGSVDDKLDGIKSKTDAIDASAITYVAPVIGSTLNVYRGDTLSASFTGLGSVVGYTALWLTIKRNTGQPDAQALVQVRKNASGSDDGLLILNGATATANLGSIAIDNAGAGNITVTLDEAATAALPHGAWVYDVQVLSGGNVTTLTRGDCIITPDVTRSVT